MSATVLTADRVRIVSGRGAALVDDVSLRIRSGELVAVVGPSGAGKTTLLQALAGLRAPADGDVTHCGPAVTAGYVPQDDIVHLESTVAESVAFAIQLRYGRIDADALAAQVASTLEALGLADRADVAVGSLSGGQRKRVALAVELVRRPQVFFLDEPTSGLDPLAAGEVIDALRALTAAGTAVVMTTHSLADVAAADRLVVVEPGGRVGYDGPVATAPMQYRPVSAARPPAEPRRPSGAAGSLGAPRPASRPLQVGLLARRNLAVLSRNRMTAAIMAGSPIAVIAMMATLFTSGDGGSTADPSAIAYWLAFGGFFFGLTFGLLQICSEMPIVRLELRHAVDGWAYLAAKAAVIVPVLLLVDTVMVLVLTMMGRLAWDGAEGFGQLVLMLGLDSLAGLAIGLLASAAVTGAVQATLALPMLCFPAVLFGGAVVPVATMSTVGRAIADVTSTRWAFEAVEAVVAGSDESLVGPAAAMAVTAIVALVAARAILGWRVRLAG